MFFYDFSYKIYYSREFFLLKILKKCGIIVSLCMFKRQIQNFIDEKQLIASSDKVLIALSGGTDSVALFRVLLQLGYQCEAAHCNFHLRGAESDRDELFVRSLCDEHQVPLHVTHFSTEAYAKEKGLSIEMAARELRYDWFEELRRSTGASVIAVAHHLDDSVETFLLNLSRGTGINGLKGIQAKNGYIVRPLLEVSRENIVDYLNYLHQDYVTDSTNLENVYMRNKIRLDIIPLFRQINPSFCESVAESSKRLAEVAAVYQQAMRESLSRVCVSDRIVDIEALKKEVSPSCVLHEWLSPCGFNASQIQNILRSLDGESGRMFYTNDWQLLRDRKQLQLRRVDEVKEVPTLMIEQMLKGADFQIVRSREVAFVDADKICFPLELRKWQSGDVFVPFGMKGSKKVRDYLRDRKMSVYDKEEQLVVTSGEQIVWLVNERVDDRFAVRNHTQKMLKLTLKGPKKA